jgi:uncharacterized protein (TIGR02588 family)
MTPHKNGFEWTIFALGLLLILTTLGYLIYAGVTRGSDPAQLSVKLEEATPKANRFLIPVLVTNTGDTTAEDVHVAVLLRTADGKEERAELQFPHVPRHARRRGWVSFETDPAKGTKLEGIIMGYREP